MIEWGDAIVTALPSDFLEVRLTFGAGDDDRAVRAARRRAPVAPALAAPGRGRGGLAVLILGIETATEQVGCAIGGHEGVLGLFESARGRRHAETLAPAIEFVTPHADVALDEISVVAVDVGPGLFTGLRVGHGTAKAIAHALRVPMIGISSLDLLAFPLRHANRTIVDRDRRQAGRAVLRLLPVRCPAACSG